MWYHIISSILMIITLKLLPQAEGHRLYHVHHTLISCQEGGREEGREEEREG